MSRAQQIVQINTRGTHFNHKQNIVFRMRMDLLNFSPDNKQRERHTLTKDTLRSFQNLSSLVSWYMGLHNLVS